MTTIDPLLSTPATAPRRVSMLEARYFLALLSMAALDLFLSAIFLHLSGTSWLIFLRLPEVIVFLVIVPLAGGRFLFAPIRRFIQTGQDRHAACERAARLGSLTVIGAAVAAALFTIWSFLLAPFLLFDVEITRDVVFILAGRAVAWVVMLPYVAAFAMQEYTVYLRRALFDRYGMVVPPGQAQLGRKMALILLGGALVPGVSIAITLMLVPEVSPITGQPRSVVVITTLIGAILALALAFRATQRSTTTAFRTLLGGMRRAQRGDLGTPIPVETDDELGRLGEGFNALTRALAEARYETERKEAERAHAASRFHEAQKRDALGRLAAGVAHDFNNILGIIVMNATMAQRCSGDDEVAQKRMAEVLTAAGRGRDLISQILDFTRDRQTEPAMLDLVENVRETVSLLRDTLARNIDITLDLPDQPLSVAGDATGLHQVLTNLLINAIHAMPDAGANLSVSLARVDPTGGRSQGLRERLGEGTTLIVYEQDANDDANALLGILEPGPHARLTVRDTGIGMSPETLRSVFNPYFTTKGIDEGTGLGLAAVAGIVEAHGGGIHVRTRIGAGSRFDIFIPCIDQG